MTDTNTPPTPANTADRLAFLGWTAIAFVVSLAPLASLVGIGWLGLRLLAN